MVDIEELVSEARAYLQKSKNNKKWCRTDEIIALLEAGATPREINRNIGGGTYSHMVSYEDIIFINSTEEPVQELEKYSKKR